MYRTSRPTTVGQKLASDVDDGHKSVLLVKVVGAEYGTGGSYKKPLIALSRMDDTKIATRVPKQTLRLVCYASLFLNLFTDFFNQKLNPKGTGY